MSTLTQLHPPTPTFTPTSLIDLSTKVYLITNASTETSKELAANLYNLHATVYLNTASITLYDETINSIKAKSPTSKGTLKPFIADLSNLQTIKPAVEAFQNDEYRLDVLFLNPSGVAPQEKRKTVNDYDFEIGTTCLASFLLVFLLP